jgi:hypothetical protein
MEHELNHWIAHYNIPIRVYAFDDIGTAITLEPMKTSDCLVGLIDDGAKDIRSTWGIIADDELPMHVLDPEFLKRVYVDIPFKTKGQLRQEIETEHRKLRTGWFIVVIWIVVIPVIVAILGLANIWIGILVLAYAIYKAVVKALKLTGRFKPTSKEIQQKEKERKMAHYYYHCERNPNAFNRLKLENFKKDLKDQTQNEAEMLKREHPKQKQ